MKTSLFSLFMVAVSTCCMGAAAQTSPYDAVAKLPPAAYAGHVIITRGPAPERIERDWAILRWTTNNPGGADEHFAVAHFGTDPKQLDQTAKSPIRLNRNHSETVFRVLVTGLKPNTTYYYKVGSVGSNGADDHVKSPELHFTTRQPVHDDKSGSAGTR